MKKLRTCIIAEAGVNHNGSLKTAAKMIRMAAKIGADVVKFQAFDVNETILKKKKELDIKLRIQKKMKINLR